MSARTVLQRFLYLAGRGMDSGLMLSMDTEETINDCLVKH